MPDPKWRLTTTIMRESPNTERAPKRTPYDLYSLRMRYLIQADLQTLLSYANPFFRRRTQWTTKIQ